MATIFFQITPRVLFRFLSFSPYGPSHWILFFANIEITNESREEEKKRSLLNKISRYDWLSIFLRYNHSILWSLLFEVPDKTNNPVVAVVEAMHSKQWKYRKTSEICAITFRTVDDGDERIKFDFGAGTIVDWPSRANSCRPPKCPNWCCFLHLARRFWNQIWWDEECQWEANQCRHETYLNFFVRKFCKKSKLLSKWKIRIMCNLIENIFQLSNLFKIKNTSFSLSSIIVLIWI